MIEENSFRFKEPWLFWALVLGLRSLMFIQRKLLTANGDQRPKIKDQRPKTKDLRPKTKDRHDTKQKWELLATKLQGPVLYRCMDLKLNFFATFIPRKPLTL
jgi:hypothetical protein